MGRPRNVSEMLPRMAAIVRRFWPYVRGQRLLLSGSMAALFVEIFLRVLEPWPLKFVFDTVLTGHTATAAFGFSIQGIDPFHLLVGAALAQILVTGLRALVSYYGTVGFALAGQKILSEVRGALFRHLQFLSLSFHNQTRSGDLVVRVISDIGILREVIVTALLPLMASILIFVSMLGLMLWLSWYLALIALIPFPFYWLRTLRISKRIHQVARDQRQRQGAMAATAAESLSAMKTVQALSLEDSFASQFVSQNTRSLKEGAKAGKLAARLERTSDLILAVSSALILLFGAGMVLKQQLTPGDLLVFLYYTKHAFRPARDFARYTARLAKATAAGERIMDILERDPEIRDLPGALPAPSFSGSITFKNVHFSYRAGPPALKGIDLDIGSRETLAITGPSGGGKSTLVSLVLRLFDPTQGEVTVDGNDIRTYTVESLRSQISTVLQDNLLFSGSIRDNIAHGLNSATDDQIVEAARLANAESFILELPDGFQAKVGERGVTLSHGQRQRIAIARAAVRQAPILILDEPTTGLDDENARWVAQAIKRLSRSCTTLMITHDLRLASCADRIVVLESGTVLEVGTPEELKSAGGRYTSLFLESDQPWPKPLAGAAKA